MYIRTLCMFRDSIVFKTVSVPERSKGVDSSSTVFALVGSNPTADTVDKARVSSDGLTNA